MDGWLNARLGLALGITGLIYYKANIWLYLQNKAKKSVLFFSLFILALEVAFCLMISVPSIIRARQLDGRESAWQTLIISCIVGIGWYALQLSTVLVALRKRAKAAAPSVEDGTVVHESAATSGSEPVAEDKKSATTMLVALFVVAIVNGGILGAMWGLTRGRNDISLSDNAERGMVIGYVYIVAILLALRFIRGFTFDSDSTLAFVNKVQSNALIIFPAVWSFAAGIFACIQRDLPVLAAAVLIVQPPIISSLIFFIYRPKCC